MKKKESVRYEELLPEEFTRRINACPIAYLPLGTLEWHGQHLPLGADGIQARGVMEILAERVGGIVLPMLFLGPDGILLEKDGIKYHGMDVMSFYEGMPQQLEGSAYAITDDLYFAILDAVFYNLARAGFKAVVGHGHGPSTEQLTSHREILAKRHGMKVFNLWELGVGEGNDRGLQTDHAAFNETSITLGLRPDLVDLSALPSDGTLIGVAGTDPRTNATVQSGTDIINENVDMIARALDVIAKTLECPDRKIDYVKVKNLPRCLD